MACGGNYSAKEVVGRIKLAINYRCTLLFWRFSLGLTMRVFSGRILCSKCPGPGGGFFGAFVVVS